MALKELLETTALIRPSYSQMVRSLLPEAVEGMGRAAYHTVQLKIELARVLAL
ncbi:MAG: hypothetical protein Q7V15_10015 [Phenylobacterium sp.]|uniref:hypothetical protein n=1 Tax=Phenylobacterium sp. TaxID=1871053 RepID=UPI0027207558|nr:hypothetical protein [Phenylobacterium sp.]MDO8901679.1 hypothetical protein [Phenylobacterium sp.]